MRRVQDEEMEEQQAQDLEDEETKEEAKRKKRRGSRLKRTTTVGLEVLSLVSSLPNCVAPVMTDTSSASP